MHFVCACSHTWVWHIYVLRPRPLNHCCLPPPPSLPLQTNTFPQCWFVSRFLNNIDNKTRFQFNFCFDSSLTKLLMLITMHFFSQTPRTNRRWTNERKRQKKRDKTRIDHQNIKRTVRKNTNARYESHIQTREKKKQAQKHKYRIVLVSRHYFVFYLMWKHETISKEQRTTWNIHKKIAKWNDKGSFPCT